MVIIMFILPLLIVTSACAAYHLIKFWETYIVAIGIMSDNSAIIIGEKKNEFLTEIICSLVLIFLSSSIFALVSNPYPNMVSAITHAIIIPFHIVLHGSFISIVL